MPLNNDYTLEMNDDATEVYMIFYSEIFQGHALWNERVSKCANEIANHPNQTLYTKDRFMNDIGPHKKPNP